MTSDARQAKLASRDFADDALISRNPNLVLVDTASDTVIDTVARELMVWWCCEDLKTAQAVASAVLAKLRETAQ